MNKLMALPGTLVLWAVPVLLVFVAGCGGGSDSPPPTGPVSVRVIVTDVQVSADDDERVESITVLTDDGEEMKIRLGEGIEPADWDPNHLLLHVGLGESLGLKIGVTYVRTGETVVATQLSE